MNLERATHVLRGNNKLIITKPLPQDAMEGTLY